MNQEREPTRIIVRRNIEAMMMLTGTTQKILGKGIGLSQGNVSRKLTAVASIDFDDLDRISKFFGVTVADIVTDGCLPAAHMIKGEL